MAAERSRINESIQGLRGAAALTVMLVHVGFMAAHGGLLAEEPPHWVEQVGPYAVMLFFCISGYLITGTLARHGDVRRFIRNRIIRIYPVFGLLHLVMFTAGPLVGYEWMGSLREDWAAWIRHFFSNLFFLPGIFDLPIAQKNAWSLSYEAGFYIIAALIFAGYQQREKALGKLLLLLGLVASSAMVAHETGCLFFVVGAGVEWLQRRGRLPALSSGIVSAFAAFFGGWLYLHDQVLLSALMVTPFFSSLAAQAGLVAGLLRASVFQWLGQVSYSLYLVHPFALEAARRVMTKVAPGLPEEMVFPLYALCGLSVALLSAALSYAWVEQRLTRFLFQSGRG